MKNTSMERNCLSNKFGVFFLTFFSYTFYHASRKSFSAIKGEMSQEQWIHSSYYPVEEQGKMYGLLDTLFMMFYAIGLYASGILGDTMDLRKMIAGGMFATSIIVIMFGFGAIIGIRSLTFYATLWGLNGLIQSTGWPANVAVMGLWFSSNERGAVLGLWSGNACFGNIVGTALVALMFAIFPSTSAWKIAMIAAALVVALHALFVYNWLVPDPQLLKSHSQSTENIENEEEDPITSFDDAEKSLLGHTPSRILAEKKGISFFKAWLIPGVIPYAFSYACLKSVNYALFFWIPFYLTVSLNMDNAQADLISMLFDVGQIIGGFLGGYVSDKLGVRSPVIVASLLMSFIAVMNLQGASQSTTSLLLLVSGFLIGGPASLISTAIAADLGTHHSIRGNAAALSTVTGIIDGTGSVGAAVVQYLVGYLANCHAEPKGCTLKSDPNCHQVCTWGPVFLLLQTGLILACICLIQLLYHELKKLYTQHKSGMESYGQKL